MNNITVEELEKNFDEILNRVGVGESFIITSPRGNVVMIPYKYQQELDDIIRMYTDHEEGS